MTTKDQVLALVDKYYTQWESDPLRMDSGYYYEVTYATMIKKVEKEILQLSVGKVPKSKNTKNLSAFGMKTSNSIWKNSIEQKPHFVSIPKYADQRYLSVPKYFRKLLFK